MIAAPPTSIISSPRSAEPVKTPIPSIEAGSLLHYALPGAAT